MQKTYDVIVVGAGHAGVEASLACARMGLQVLTATTNVSRAAYMACNPSIGGLAKGNLVKEIDVLGGLMARAGDEACLQFKHLNSKKGPAVRGSRVQCDKDIYSRFVFQFLTRQKNITLIEEEVLSLIIKNGKCGGVKTGRGDEIFSKTVILTTGTFMSAVMHIGSSKTIGARRGDKAHFGLSEQLKKLGFQVTRLKTGTPARIDKKSIDFNLTREQKGDARCRPLSFFSPKKPKLSPKLCHLTYTNEKTHEVIRSHLHLSPLFSGAIKSRGPRYCPSIEDKVTRFSEKKAHQIFLEPETKEGHSIYVQGMSTSLPAAVQEKFLKTIPGLENVKVLQWGYAVEYDFINPIQTRPTLETKKIKNLFLAGQINGSSGYEEAAAQGLAAGVNASAAVKNRPPFVLGRGRAYTGVLIDDLVTKGTNEPYRMLTSRAEHRLVLREDNTLERLFSFSKEYGLLSPPHLRFLENILEKRKTYKLLLQKTKWQTKDLKGFAQEKSKIITAFELLKRPELSAQNIENWGGPKAVEDISEPVEIEIKYEGYIKRQNELIEKNKKMDRVLLKNIDYKKVKGLSAEAREKLEEIKPENLGQAGRILGVGPAALQALIVYVHGRRLKRKTSHAL